MIVLHGLPYSAKGYDLMFFLDENHKNLHMNASNKTAQLLNENFTWKRLLESFIQENNFLKTRLSEVVDRQNDKMFIACAEEFQNDFILKDEFILDIVKDIKGQEKNLQFASAQKSEPDEKTCKRHEKLRNEMTNLENEFFVLKTQFKKYLLSVA